MKHAPFSLAEQVEYHRRREELRAELDRSAFPNRKAYKAKLNNILRRAVKDVIEARTTV